MRIRTLVTAGALALTSLVAASPAHAAYCDKTFIGPDGDRIMVYVCYDDTLDNVSVHVSSSIEALVIGGFGVSKSTVDGWVTYNVCVSYYFKGVKHQVCEVLPIQ